MIVSDDVLATEFLTRQVVDLGHQVIATAEDESEAASAVRAFDPDLLLLHLNITATAVRELSRSLEAERQGLIVYPVSLSKKPQVAAAIELAVARRLHQSQSGMRARGQIASSAGSGQLQAAHQLAAEPAATLAAAEGAGEAASAEHWDARPAEPDVPGANPKDHVRLVIADAHKLLAETLALVLAQSPDLEVVGVESVPSEALAKIRRSKPDVVLLSYFLMQHENRQIPAVLRTEYPDIKLIVLISSPDHDTLWACLQADSVGYVVRDTAPAELVQLIKRAHAGEVLFPPKALVELMRTRMQPRTPVRPQATANLGQRELEVLQLSASGLKPEQIADELVITVHTVRTHLKNAMAKLGVHSKFEALLAARRAGLIDLPDE